MKSVSNGMSRPLKFRTVFAPAAKDELMPALMIEKWARANTNAVVQVGYTLSKFDALQYVKSSPLLRQMP